MTKITQGVEAIIQKYQWRLQKLKENQATLGISTAPRCVHGNNG